MKQTTARRLAILALALGIHGAPASAQNAGAIWRCGSSYADRPCEGGRPIEAADTRSSTQESEARAAAQRNTHSAHTLEYEREQREAAAPRQPALIPGPREATARTVAAAPEASPIRLKKSPTPESYITRKAHAPSDKKKKSSGKAKAMDAKP